MITRFGVPSPPLGQRFTALGPFRRPMARPDDLCREWGRSGGCQGCWWVAAALSVAVQGEAVDAEREGQQVQVLTFVARMPGRGQPRASQSVGIGSRGKGLVPIASTYF